MLTLADYLAIWYPLPSCLPDDVQELIIGFAFDPEIDPW